MRPSWFQILLVVCVAIQQIVGGVSCCCFAEQLLDEVRAVFAPRQDVVDVVGRTSIEPRKAVRACCRRVDGSRVDGSRVDAQREAATGPNIEEFNKLVTDEGRIGAMRQRCDCGSLGLVIMVESELGGRHTSRQDRPEGFFGSVVVGSIGLSIEWVRESSLFFDRFEGIAVGASSSQRCALLNRWVC